MSAGFTRSARDVVVVGVIAAAAVVGLFIWDGGDAPSASDLVVPGTPTVPGVTVPGATTAAPAVTGAPSAATAAPATTAGPVTASPGLTGDVTKLPAPAAGVEVPNAPAGTRTWTVLASTVAAVRDPYLVALASAGWTQTGPTVTFPDAETYIVANAAAGQVRVTITQAGPDVLVAATP